MGRFGAPFRVWGVGWSRRVGQALRAYHKPVTATLAACILPFSKTKLELAGLGPLLSRAADPSPSPSNPAITNPAITNPGLANPRLRAAAKEAPARPSNAPFGS